MTASTLGVASCAYLRKQESKMTLETLITALLLTALVAAMAMPPYLFYQGFIARKRPFKVRKQDKKTVKSKKVVMHCWKSISKALN